MTKKPRFPVKSFDLSGSALTNTRRAALIRAALETPAPRVSPAGKIVRSATATGSGHVAFKDVVVSKPIKATKKATKGTKIVLRKVRTNKARREKGSYQSVLSGA